MKLLAIDTATEQCSVALVANATWSRSIPTARGHADTILPMIDEVLAESGLVLRNLDGLAFGRGPGSFTGVRIAVSVIQGLAFATRLPVVGVSNLAAVAQQAAQRERLEQGARIAVCMDARMKEVYWAVYRVGDDGLVALEGDERVCAPEAVITTGPFAAAAGTGWQPYPNLTVPGWSGTPQMLLPSAVEIARLGARDLLAGHGVAAAGAQPVYLRDNVVTANR